nr:pentatricopeptide repeat-containing protein At3g02330 [Tanacetum cinerariifolium]
MAIQSVYVKNFPLNATIAELEIEFKNFRPIKQGGVQVRVDADDVIWRTLLGICKLQNNVELTEKVASSLLWLVPQDSSAYVLLANIYVDDRMWEEAKKIRKNMWHIGLKKEPSCSWIEVMSELHMFTIADKSHPGCSEINEKLDELICEMEWSWKCNPYVQSDDIRVSAEKQEIKYDEPFRDILQISKDKTYEKVIKMLEEKEECVESEIRVSVGGESFSSSVKVLMVEAVEEKAIGASAHRELEIEFKNFGPIQQGGFQVRVDADDVIWRTLLGICKLQKNVELAEKIASLLLRLVPQDSSAYVLLANIYADDRMWEEVKKIRKNMRHIGLKKEPGCSWIGVMSELHMFTIADEAHTRCSEIYEKLDELICEMAWSGYVTDTNFTFDVEDILDEKQEVQPLCAVR